MKALFHFTAPLLALITMIACTELEVSENPQNSNNELLQKLSITGKDFKFDGKTRSSVNIGDSGASFTWDEDDVIGIFPDKGDQVSFAMDDGAGTQTATFSGGGWALKSSAKYAAYYPHVYENRDMTQIPVSYVGQTQNGNANTDHIGAYDFMAAGVSTPENGAVAFDMQHLGALVQLTITVPEPSTLTKVVLTSSTEFTETGAIDLTSEIPAITAVTQSNTFEIALNNVTTTEANDNVTVYFMVAPIDLTDSELTTIIHFANETTREVEITGKNLKAGKAYRLTAEIEANFYLDGVAYMSDAGVLSEIINAEELNTISSLKIIGKINGSDILTIKSMSALKSLDLSMANIVSGGKGYYSYYDDDDDLIYLYTKDHVITERLFYNSKFERIILPSNITSIESLAFAYCDKLNSILIPDSTTSIGSKAFYNCTELQYITLSKDLKTLSSTCFGNCSKIENIDIPDGVTNIGANAFSNCSSLQSIKFPNSVTYLGQSAFENCISLVSITIPPISTINEDTFGGCSALTTVALPNTITIIDDDAFLNCTCLNNVTIPESVTYLSGFRNCKFSEFTIPSSVKTIGPHAFDNCDNLTSITIPEGVTSINYSAFYDCNGLKGALVIPNSVTQIGDQAFQNCSGLTTINFGSSLTFIGWNAFRDCTGVSTLTLPSSLQTINDLAFGEMQLTSVTCLRQTPPTLNGDPFFKSKTNILYVPSGTKDKYTASTKWNSSFSSIIELDY